MSEQPSTDDLLLLQALLEEQATRKKYCKIDYMYPETGEFSRDKYKKQLEFFKAGANHKMRLLSGGNQSGKTLSGNYEAALHLTGRYPSWWEGLRLHGDVNICIVGETATFTRDILQKYILGDRIDPGTGFVPKHMISGQPVSLAGTAQAIDTLTVTREDGGIGVAYFKSYQQGRKAFQGARFHFILLDEEPDPDVFTEALTRTATTNGYMALTFTPLQGYSQVVEKFTDRGMWIEGEHPLDPQKYLVRMTWDDIPHISEETKEYLLSQYPAHERDARSKGLPATGEGAVFPVQTSEYVVEPFKIPDHWPRAYGLDPGLTTAAVWAALDPESGVYYIYSEHYQKEQNPAGHARAIMYGNGFVSVQGRAPWIRGAIDPAASNRTAVDVQTIASQYRDLGLDLVFLRQAREAGILRINQMLQSGTLKIFSTCQNLLREMHRAVRDDTGKVKNQHAYHATDAMRYVLNDQLNIFRTHKSWKESQKVTPPQSRRDRGASSITGY